ncbi:MAG: hypothetical protein ACQESR_01445 [Planctomycetota bacterium]
MSETKPKRSYTRYPVVSHGAEYLVMGHLMRRNILTYKAPPNNEGYDLICIHPDPRTTVKQVRVQVKSRLATDCDRGFPVKARTFEAFDYLVVVFLNVGYFLQMRKRHAALDGTREPEFYTLPVSVIRKNHDTSSSWHKVKTRGLDLDPFKGEVGFEQIAKDLKIPYPDRTE